MNYTAEKTVRFAEYIIKEMVKIYNCIDAEISSDYGKTTYLGWELGDISNTLEGL